MSLFDFNSDNDNTGGATDNFTAIFGTYCRTCEYQIDMKLTNDDETKESDKKDSKKKVAPKPKYYMEMYQSSALAGTWTVTRIDTKLKKARQANNQIIEVSETRSIAKDVSFANALQKLADFENFYQNAEIHKESPHSVTGPSAKKLEWDHFFAFAVREGFVFDINRRAWQRPTKEALPSDKTFDRAALDAANKIWREVQVQRSAPAPLPVMSQTLLYEMFNRAASTANFEDSLNNRQAIHELDKFFDIVQKAYDEIDSYIKEYKNLGKGESINKSIKILDRAVKQLDNVEQYNVETTKYSEYLQQCKLACYIIHVQGVSDLNNENVFDENDRDFTVAEQRKSNIKTIKEKINLIAKLYKNMGANRQEIEAAKSTAGKAGGPVMPENFTLFIELYRERRKEYKKLIDEGKEVTIHAVTPAVFNRSS